MIAPPKPPSHEALELLIKEARERQLRRRLIGTAAIAIAAGLGLGIYAAASGSRPSPSSVTRRDAAPPVVGCRMPNVVVQVLPMTSPTGLDRVLLRLRNKSAQRCVLAGFPVLRFYDRRGSIPFQYDRDVIAKPVLLRPGRLAYAVYSKFRCDIGIGRSATRGTIAFRNDPGPTAGLPGGPAICKPGIPAEGRTVLVYPFEPTLRLAYETSLALR